MNIRCSLFILLISSIWLCCFPACMTPRSDRTNKGKQIDDIKTLDARSIDDVIEEIKQALVGGEYDDINPRTDDKSLLHFITASGATNIYHHIISNYDINAKDSLMNSPLHYAIINGHYDIAKDLILKGADVNIANAKGQTPLHYLVISIPAASRILPSIPPIKGPISSSYGIRHSPIFGGFQFHYGIDIAAPKGTPIKATANGRVVRTGWMPIFGRAVFVQHGNGYCTIYAHCNTITATNFMKVKAGDIIATVGETGNATGSHCHYQITYDSIPINPFPMLHVNGNNQNTGEAISLLQLLKDKGADFNKLDNNHRSPLHYSIYGNFNVIKKIVECGVDLNPRDNRGRTPLHLAAASNIEAARYLLQKGALANLRTYSGYETEEGKIVNRGITPLGIALNSEWLAMVQLFAQYGGRE